MRLRELRLSGFKSFVDPVRVPIEVGLTGIVGPNGCGKSNLLESVRWAMGATSAKSMRGGDMDDVIFAGTHARPAREHAEVVIALDNSDRRAPAAFNDADELEVSRRIRREAGSTYKINGREVRAKDVQLLFADASTGANSPALVRQGQISELIAAKPENRRRVLEEAAGIGGLQQRRHEADLKLKAADVNLTRLDEIIAEIEGHAGNLRKQARQAERYRVLADELRRLEALLMHRRHADAQRARADAETELRARARAVAAAAEAASLAQRIVLEAQARLAPLREEEIVAAAVLRQLDGERVGLTRDVRESEAAILRLEGDLERFAGDHARETAMRADALETLDALLEEGSALEALSGDAPALAAARERADLAEGERQSAEAALDAQAGASAVQRARADAAARALRDLDQRLARLEERARAARLERADIAAVDEGALERARARIAACERDCAASEALMLAADEEVQTAQALERAARSAFDGAQARAHALDVEARALKGLLAKPKTQKYLPAFDQIKCQPGYERAVAAALGDEVDASLDRAAPLRWAGAPEKHTIWSWPEGAAPLSRFLEAPREMAERIKFCAVLEDVSRAPDLMKTLPPGARLVSRAGDMWSWDGLVREADAGAPGAAARLEQANRLSALREEIERAREGVESANAAWSQARAGLLSADRAAARARADAPAQRKSLEAARLALHACESEHARARARGDALLTQLALVESERAEVSQARGALAQEAEAIGAPDEHALDALRTRAQGARERAAQARAELSALLREREARAARSQAIAKEQSAWSGRAQACAKRIAELEEARAHAQSALMDARAIPEMAREKLAKLENGARVAEERRSLASDALAGAETRARESDRAARAAEAAHAEAREARAGAQARLDGAQQRLDSIVSHIRETLGADPEELSVRAGPLMSGPLAGAPLADLERKADRVRAERDATGPVNLRAETELEETQARLQTLVSEKADVVAAIAKLRRAIGALNSEGRARLLAAFEKVNENFSALFSTLFEGGHGELRLVEPDEGAGKDPLAAGLEIFAQPPGKRLAALSLMSGGEQALTAAALIFAVFLANPAPLCVLDEVDAPLDDANVDRFCRMLDEMRKRTDTRFLVITHNPMTMARMDRLYGVTMAEHGVSHIVSVDLARAAALAAA